MHKMILCYQLQSKQTARFLGEVLCELVISFSVVCEKEWEMANPLISLMILGFIRRLLSSHYKRAGLKFKRR